MERAFTDFLTPDSTFLLGAATVMSLSGSNFFYNQSASGALADARAMRQDFLMIGQDMIDVAANIEKDGVKQLALDLGL